MGDVLFHADDELSERHLGEALGRDGISKYVQWGLTIDVDYARATMDVSAGKAFLLDNHRDVTILADAVAGVTIPSDGVNHVYLTVVSDGEDPPDYHETYAVRTSQTPPSGPALRIGVVDMDAQTVTPLNRETPVTDARSYKGTDIDADGDGVVNRATWADNVDGDDVNGSVPEADHAGSVDGEDVSGAVGAAAHADTADSADTATNAEHADEADHADSADSAGSADRADTATNAGNLGAERLNATDLSNRNRSVCFPGVEIESGEEVWDTRHVNSDETMRILAMELATRAGGFPSGVDFSYTNTDTGDDQFLVARRADGTVQNPLAAYDGATDVRFLIENHTNSTVTVSAVAQYLLID